MLHVFQLIEIGMVAVKLSTLYGRHVHIESFIDMFIWYMGQICDLSSFIDRILSDTHDPTLAVRASFPGSQGSTEGEFFGRSQRPKP